MKSNVSTENHIFNYFKTIFSNEVKCLTGYIFTTSHAILAVHKYLIPETISSVL